jgi:Ca2+-binding EF-hand superfamily protein
MKKFLLLFKISNLVKLYNGYISVSDSIKELEKLEKELIKCDTNKDGKIQVKDFIIKVLELIKK